MDIVVVNHVTLDGVMQGPGWPEEDTRGGFTHGGWADADTDDVMLKAWGEEMNDSSGFLFGRRTYEGIMSYWNKKGGAFRDSLNSARKYVVSESLSEPLEWPNSTLISGDVPARIAELKEEPGDDLHIMGSGKLIQSLGAHDLIDKYVLSIHALVLGTGLRLFEEGFVPTAFKLAGTTTTTTGVVIATFTNGTRPKTP
ncbi:dihydrofolate reductase family protein [Amycolatopsis vastitatis]|uniref:Deaminase n=1 Tax=Amycolatopsis vastitatis TaxID=1905142 RepID=A0A229SLH2_9PSEU|nr:dihydrofolate reductase family protein [Amycolatopsis vastitatis]OXM59599.1 deaminase [Amycolatopsis vastitatis]